MHINRSTRRRRLINLTPLIDVVFLLLIFFMLATSFLDARAVSVSVPKLDTGTDTASVKGAFLIRIKPGDALELNGKPITLDQLENRAKVRVDKRPDQAFQVFPDGSVPLQRIMAVLDRISAAGGVSVTLERQEQTKQ